MSWQSMGAPAQAGPIRGAAGGYRWEAILARAPVSYGLNPDTLYKGHGRIVRLALYAPVPGTAVWRKVACYHRGWLFGRKAHLAGLRRAVAAIGAAG